MALIRDYNSSAKTIAASGTVTFNSSDVPSTGICAYHFTQTGSGNTLNTISRIRVKANGQTITDTTPAFLRASYQHASRGRLTYPANQAMDNGGSAGTAVDWRRFSIIFADLSAPTPDMAQQSQFPRGANVTIEIVYTSGAGAGSCFIAWSQTNVAPAMYPKMISQPMQIAASQSNSRYNFADEGVIRQTGLNSIGLTRLRTVLSGTQVYHASGQQTASNATAVDSAILETECFYERHPDVQAGTAAQTTTFYNPIVVGYETDIAAASGNSFVELSTDVNWGGTSNELFVLSQVRQ